MRYRVKALEDIGPDLQQYYNWDSVSPVASVVLQQQEGIIGQCMLHLEGMTESKRVDARTVLGPNYTIDNHQVVIGPINLAGLRFRGSLMSDWVAPAEFNYTVQRPSTVTAGEWRDLDMVRVQQDGGQPLWLRAHAQPWTGHKIKVTFGIFSCKDIRRVPDYNHHRFPMVTLFTIMVPFLPCPRPELALPLPFVPYVIDDRDEVEDDAAFIDWTAALSASIGFMRNTSAPHGKGSLASLNTALEGGEWRREKASKYVFPALKEPVAPADLQDTTGEEESTHYINCVAMEWIVCSNPKKSYVIGLIV